MSETNRTPQNQNPQRSRKEHWYRRIFDALVPATRAKIQHTERHVLKAVNEQVRALQNELAGTQKELINLQHENLQLQKLIFEEIARSQKQLNGENQKLQKQISDGNAILQKQVADGNAKFVGTLSALQEQITIAGTQTQNAIKSAGTEILSGIAGTQNIFSNFLQENAKWQRQVLDGNENVAEKLAAIKSAGTEILTKITETNSKFSAIKENLTETKSGISVILQGAENLQKRIADGNANLQKQITDGNAKFAGTLSKIEATETQILENITKSVTKLNSIDTNETMEFQKIKSQVIRLTRIEILKTLLPELIKSWKVKFPMNSQALKQINESIYFVSGPGAQLKQAFLNEQLSLTNPILAGIEVDDIVPFFKNLISLCLPGSSVFQSAITTLSALLWSTGQFKETIQLFEKFYGDDLILPTPAALRVVAMSYLHCGNAEKAKILTKKYLSLFNETELWRHYDFAFLANELGVKNQDIQLVLKVVGRTIEASKNKTFEKMLEGKRVAIVGNGPQEIGRRNGKKIDSYDIVIRFNDFPTDVKFTQDYGRKTDIWARTFWISKNYKKENYHGIKTILLCDALRLQYPDLETIQEIDERKPENLIALPPSIHYELYLNEKINHASNGTLLIAWVKKICPNLSADDIFGFSFKDKEAPRRFTHYYDTLNLQKGTCHNVNKERVYLRKLLSMAD